MEKISTELIAAALGITLKILWDYLKKKIKEKESFKNTLVGIGQVYAILTSLLNEVGVIRANIYKTENGGGVPKLESTLFSSLLYESHTSRPMKLLWQRQIMDSHYIDSLLKCYTEKFTVIKVNDLPEGSQQKTLYLSEEAGIVEIHRLKVSKTQFIYLEIYLSTQDDNTPNEDTIKMVSINTLRNLFFKYDLSE